MSGSVPAFTSMTCDRTAFRQGRQRSSFAAPPARRDRPSTRFARSWGLLRGGALRSPRTRATASAAPGIIRWLPPRRRTHRLPGAGQRPREQPGCGRPSHAAAPSRPDATSGAIPWRALRRRHPLPTPAGRRVRRTGAVVRFRPGSARAEDLDRAPGATRPCGLPVWDRALWSGLWPQGFEVGSILSGSSQLLEDAKTCEARN